MGVKKSKRYSYSYTSFPTKLFPKCSLILGVIRYTCLRWTWSKTDFTLKLSDIIPLFYQILTYVPYATKKYMRYRPWQRLTVQTFCASQRLGLQIMCQTILCHLIILCVSVRTGVTEEVEGLHFM